MCRGVAFWGTHCKLGWAGLSFTYDGTSATNNVICYKAKISCREVNEVDLRWNELQRRMMMGHELLLLLMDDYHYHHHCCCCSSALSHKSTFTIFALCTAGQTWLLNWNNILLYAPFVFRRLWHYYAVPHIRQSVSGQTRAESAVISQTDVLNCSATSAKPIHRMIMHGASINCLP